MMFKGITPNGTEVVLSATDYEAFKTRFDPSNCHPEPCGFCRRFNHCIECPFNTSNHGCHTRLREVLGENRGYMNLDGLASYPNKYKIAAQKWYDWILSFEEVADDNKA